jgi:hypothetical protein
MHAVVEGDGSDTLWVHTHGLAALGLPEIELVGVPLSMRGFAHGILFDIMGYMKTQKAIGPDEHIAGALVHAEQRAAHYTTSRLIDRPDDPAHSGFLRFVDYKREAATGFPKRLFAAHIVALGELERSAVARERSSRMALSVHPGDEEEWRAQSDPSLNPGNWVSWDTLGHALCDQGRIEEGLQCFRAVVERCPAAALRVRDIYEELVSAGKLPSAEVDPRSSFWLGLDRSDLEAEAGARGEIAG